MVKKNRADSPISFGHMFVWCPLLDLHLEAPTTQMSGLIKISNQIRHTCLNMVDALLRHFQCGVKGVGCSYMCKFLVI
jgi:hypothetical protein